MPNPYSIILSHSTTMPPSPTLHLHRRHRRHRLHHQISNIKPLTFPSSTNLHLLISPLKCVNSDHDSVESNDSNHMVNNFLRQTRKQIDMISSVFPGGSWWNLPGDKEDVPLLAKQVTFWRAMKKIWDILHGDRWIIVAAIHAIIVEAVLESSIPHFLTATIFSVKGADTIFLRNVKLLAVLGLISGISTGIRTYCSGIVSMILVKRIREQLYSSLLFQDISFFDNESVGGLTSRLGADSQQASRIIGNQLYSIFRNGFQGVCTLTYLLMMSWQFGLCTLFICCALLGITLHNGRYQKMASRSVQKFNASANTVAQETLSLIRTVRIYGTETKEHERYQRWLLKLADISLRQSAASGFWQFCFHTLRHSIQVIAVLLGGVSILTGNITAEKLSKLILYSERTIYSTWWMGDSVSGVMQWIGASEKIFNLMDLSPCNQLVASGVKLEKLIGHLEFLDVSFHYPSRPTVSVVQHVNLVIHPSEVIAIVGLSGSGKSTLTNLLLRLYEPTGGQILIDGVPLHDLNVTWWRENIGYVGQEPKLFHMDVISNIKYGCKRDINQEEIEWAAKQADAHEFISTLPNGYGTVIDDRVLSGGQKQRIAIARAIVRDPKILVLDEATSALDAESEQNVKGVLGSLKRDFSSRSVIVIAHRLSTIQACDRILVMDAGQIVEDGSHSELLSKNGVYARLISKQAEAVE